MDGSKVKEGREEGSKAGELMGGVTNMSEWN